MNKQALAFGCTVLQLATWNIAQAGQFASTEVRGLRCIGNAPFPSPAGTTPISIPGGDFEADGKTPPGWTTGGCTIVTAADAPQGKTYCAVKVKKDSALRTPVVPAEPGRPYFLSCWVKSPADCWATITFSSDERLQSFGADYPGIPFTNNQWKRLGIYFWMPAQTKTIQFHVNPREDGPDGQLVCIDDIRLRTATEPEMADAYEAERKHLPAYDVTPRPGDGKNLALSIAKWEGRAGIPGKPFVIWAIGSSWTDWQEDGYGLIDAIRKRYPHAPQIIYKKHCGAGTPWDYAAGWVPQFVAADKPDLIFSYTGGTAEGMEALLRNIQRFTTADVIIPSIHFRPENPRTPEDIENSYGPWGKVRELCKRYNAEFVENRREMAEYLKLPGIKADDLLWDHNHQGLHGRIRIWDNVSRHLANTGEFTCTPESRERRISVAPPAETATEAVTLTGEWKTAGGTVHTGKAGSILKARFTGNRIDVLGRNTTSGGTAKVLIDGTPAERAPVFETTYIVAKPKVWPQALGGQPGDHAPHAVTLGGTVIPQTWTITCTSDVGDYKIAGSVTGPDGEGNVTRPFVSKSSQIAIDPKLWRNGRVVKDGKTMYGTGLGDTFTFDVYRSATAAISFKCAKPGPFSETLVQNLPNGEHTLEIVTEGNGDVDIDGLYVFQPPLKN